MGYGKEVYAATERILRERRRQAEEQAEARRADFYQKIPSARKLESRLASTAVAAAKAVLAGKDAKENLRELRTENRALQDKLSALLREAGLEEDALLPRYHCPRCRDTGYVNGKMCSCMKELLRTEAYNRLNALTPLSLSSFSSFSLDYYTDVSRDGKLSDRELMRRTFRFCENYARSFTLLSPNLVMTGGTGLGKTHLSLAIARECIKNGFGVVYSSVSSLIAKLESEHFGHGDSEDTFSLLQNCDLLILDDLGTEFRSSFSAAAVYHIVNTRLLTQKPTIISTNLSTKEMVECYSERFTSRIIGSYKRIVFVGKDVRQLKRRNK